MDVLKINDDDDDLIMLISKLFPVEFGRIQQPFYFFYLYAKIDPKH